MANLVVGPFLGPVGIGGADRLREYLEGSHFRVEPWNPIFAWRAWKRSRRLIRAAINCDGTILDYGCANGFLLWCLAGWSAYRLEPFGVDLDYAAVMKARELFPSTPGNFCRCDALAPEIANSPTSAARLFRPAPGIAFPTTFNFVYWAAWDNVSFASRVERRFFLELFELVAGQGRLILGLYGTPGSNDVRLQRLIEAGFAPAGRVGTDQFGVTIAWFDKNGIC